MMTVLANGNYNNGDTGIAADRNRIYRRISTIDLSPICSDLVGGGAILEFKPSGALISAKNNEATAPLLLDMAYVGDMFRPLDRTRHRARKSIGGQHLVLFSPATGFARFLVRHVIIIFPIWRLGISVRYIPTACAPLSSRPPRSAPHRNLRRP